MAAQLGDIIVKRRFLERLSREPVWPSGKALAAKRKDLGSILLRLSFLFEKVVVCGHCFVTLSLRITETLKWHSLLPILMQESFLVMTV